MLSFQRIVLAATCAALMVAGPAYAAPTGLSLFPGINASQTVSAAQQLAQNAIPSPQAASTVAAASPVAAAPEPQASSTPEGAASANPASGATVAVVTPPVPVSASSAAPEPVASPAAQTGSDAVTHKAIAPKAAVLDQKPVGEKLLDHVSAEARGNPDNWAVHAYKSHHRLDVYFQGQLYKTYHAVFGRSRWMGAKEWEGDLRTPEGDYLIIAKHPSRRFGWFLRLNYPNAIDQARFDQLRAERELPVSAREGGQIGIHGTDNPMLNLGDINWTTGCISIDNADIVELARLLPTGTLVVIDP
jgi:lipoprotein-anchoring transpeptidase ErfK/SrfK